jgi:hypothetical protein
LRANKKLRFDKKEQTETARLPQLVPIFGVLADKSVTLRGDLPIQIHEHLHAHILLDTLEQIKAQLSSRAHARESRDYD